MTKCSCGYRDKDKCNKENGSNNGKMCLKESLDTSKISKIKWHVEISKELIPHYVIIAEISLGSARYREMHSITRQEIDAFRNGSGVLWKIIEKIQWNMLDALGYYESQTAPEPPDNTLNPPYCCLCLAPLPKFGIVAISYLCSRCKEDVYGTGEQQ